MSKFCKALLCALVLASAARADFIDLWANKVDMPLNKAPRSGQSKVLVIPVQIDFGSNLPLDTAELKAFFTGAPSQDVFNFRGYYQRASLGRYLPEPTVAPLVHYNGCPVMLASSPTCSIGRSDVSALKSGMDFVRDVFRRTHDENKVDFSQFDVNGLGGQPDGVIDGVILIVNAPGVGIAFPIEYLNDGSNLNGGNGGAFVLDGIKVPYAAIGGMSMAGGKPRFDLVVLHEFGHVLGLADLYYEHPPMGDPYPKWQGLHFSLMGDYEYDERATLPDAESRRALNWQDVHVVSGSETLTLKPAADGGFAVKLGQMNSVRQEYFLVEARGPVGAFDKTADGSGKPVWGLSITHVDWSRGPKADQGAWTERLISCLDCTPWHPFLRNLESSNLWGLVFAGPGHTATDGSFLGESDDRVLFTTGSLASVPNAGVLSQQNRYTGFNWYDGTVSGISIENVTINADHTITADFTAPAVADPCKDVVCAPLEQCVRSGVTAGSCESIVAPSPDGGTIATSPGDAPPPPKATGCSSGGVPGALGVLALAMAVGLLRRRRAA